MTEPRIRTDTGLALQLLQIAVVVIGGVWAVSEIRTTTETLGVEIRHLSAAVASLAGDAKDTRTVLGAHETRIRLLERSADAERK